MTDKKPAKEDRRVKKTRRLLREHLIRLLRAKPLSEITTTELCRAADVNRNTFYMHYKSPTELFEEIQDEYYQQARGAMLDLKTSSLYEVTYENLRVAKGNQEFALLLSRGGNTPNGIIQKLWNQSRESWFEKWAEEGVGISQTEMERTFTFAANGYAAAMDAWVRAGMREDIESVAHSITDMSIAAIRAGLKESAER